MSNSPFYNGASARLHCPCGEPVIVLSKTAEPTLDALERPGQFVVVAYVAPGSCWPDRRSANLAAAALQQGGVVALAFSALADAEACMGRLTGKRANAPGGRA